MRVAVIAGGRSSEREVSFASGKAVAAGLVRGGHDPLLVEVRADGRWTWGGDEVSISPGGGLLEADVAFPTLHGPLGEDGTVQGALEIAAVPYVGAGVLGSAICMDKPRFKALMGGLGVAQADYVVLRRGAGVGAAAKLSLPLFVKPARLGSSIGITKVRERAQLEGALELAFEHGADAIVETMSRGIEVECAVMGNGAPWAAPPAEISVRSDWCDFDAKYRNGWRLVWPARLPSMVRDRIRTLALRIYRHLGLMGLARVDFFVERSGRLLLNEVNTLPGLGLGSSFPLILKRSGISYEAMLERLLELALERP